MPAHTHAHAHTHRHTHTHLGLYDIQTVENQRQSKEDNHRKKKHCLQKKK